MLASTSTLRSVSAAPGRLLLTLTGLLACLAPAARAAPQEEELDPAIARHLTTLAESPGLLKPAVWDELVEADHAQVYRALVGALNEGTLPSAALRGRALRALGMIAVDSAKADRRENAVQVLYDRAIAEDATQAERLAACAALGRAGDFGREVLMRVVETEPDTWVRLGAFATHAEGVEPGEYVVYREKAGFSIQARNDDALVGDTDPLLRPTAFGGVVHRLSTKELERALEDEDLAVRQRALELMGERGYPAAVASSKKLFGAKEADGPLREVAVDVLARREPTEALDLFMEEAKSRDMDRAAQRRAAAWIANMRSSYVYKNEVRKRLESARPPQLFFAIQAVAPRQAIGDTQTRLDQENNEEKIDDSLSKLLHHKDPEVAALSAEALVRREASLVAEELAKQAARRERPEAAAVLLHSYARVVRAADREVFEPLREALTENPSEPVLVACVRGLLAIDPSSNEDVIALAFESESSGAKLAAIQALIELGWEDAPHFLIEALPDLRGRLRTAALDSLRATAGEDFGDTDEAWIEWWEAAEDSARRGVVEEEDEDAPDIAPDGLTADGLEIEDDEDAPPPLPDPAEFTAFGRPVDTGAVLFAVDGGPGGKQPFVSERGRLTQLEAVALELERVLGDLPDGVLFDINLIGAGERGLLFGEPRPASEASRAEAVEFLGAWKPGKAAEDPVAELCAALEDPLFDSAVTVDFGGLSAVAGEQRAQFALWNAHRVRRVHGVSLGQRSGLLYWLAADTGGNFVYAP